MANVGYRIASQSVRSIFRVVIVCCALLMLMKRLHCLVLTVFCWSGYNVGYRGGSIMVGRNCTWLNRLFLVLNNWYS